MRWYGTPWRRAWPRKKSTLSTERQVNLDRVLASDELVGRR